MISRPYPRLLRPPGGSFFLLGPRGTGKSTWLREEFQRAHWIDLLDEALYQSLLAEPGRFAAELRAVRTGTVVIDEVQRLPWLLNEVHRHIESRSLRFVLCGSSARKLKSAGTNLLAGRAAMRAMHPLVPEELGSDFELEAILSWGSLPVIWRAPDRAEALRAYAQLYLSQEIQAEALVRNLPGFARFLPIAALMHGQVLNVSNLSRDAGVARTTVADYLGILHDTMLTFELPAYEARLRVRERRHPKLYWTDPGVTRAMRREFGPPRAEERGHLFEGWIVSLARAYRDYRGAFDECWYWASGKGSSVEVDLLLRAGRSLCAIEIKSSRTVREDDLRGLRAIADLPPNRGAVNRRLVVFLGDRPQRSADGIDILPVADFLRDLEAGRLAG